MNELKLTRNQVALVDDGDFDEIRKYKWRAIKRRYGGYAAISQIYNPHTQKLQTIYMHRQIMSCPQGMDIDHIDHNTLNNQRNNLRICTRSQNMANGLSRKNSSSQYKGVYYCKQTKRWAANLTHEGKVVWLGRHKTEIEAAKVYDKAAKTHFGEFAYLNFSKQTPKGE